MSWKTEVIADNSGTWASNGLTFSTREQAEGYVHNLFMRWTAVRETRVMETSDSVSHVWRNGKLMDIEHVQEAAEMMHDYDVEKNGE